MAAAQQRPSRRVVCWFRDDLRLHDNLGLAQAAQMVLPLFCFDPRQFVLTCWGNKKTGDHRAKFLLESVLDLKRNLQGVGSDLLIHMGKPEDAIREHAAEGSNTFVLGAEQVTSEELDVEAKAQVRLSLAGVQGQVSAYGRSTCLAVPWQAQVRRALKGRGELRLLWQHTLYHRDDVPFARDMSDLPDTFTPVKQKIEAKCEPRKEVPTVYKGQLPLPSGLDQQLSFQPSSVEDLNAVVPEGAPQLSTPEPHASAALPCKGGESEALKRLKHYFWDTDRVAEYFNIRNEMLGGDYSTKFSSWLAHGCISPRRIYHELKRYESERTANKSTYWVQFELTWRDYYRFWALKVGSRMFLETGTQRGMRPKWNGSDEVFQRWRDGLTGWPLVDANMRELKLTGFMSNRGRQNVASNLVLDLGCDWRKGADWFESVLHDYDVCSNWGNWVAAAGMTGGRINHFNITKQSKDYDDKGDYVRTWLPELKNVATNRIHEPWLMSRAEQDQYGVIIGQDYPAPVPKEQRVRVHDGAGPGRGPGGGRGGGRRGGRGGHRKQGGGRGGRPDTRHHAI